MAKKRDTKPKDLESPDKKGFSRRDFIKKGAVAGVGAAALGGFGSAIAQNGSQNSRNTEDVEWDYEADIVVIGAGCTGLPAAIRARDLGASVLVLDQNFDVGGVLIHSGGQTSLGGGDPIQLRDIAGESDPEGFVTVPPVEPVEALTEDPDFLFRDMTDWSVLDGRAQAPYRYNERDLHRAWADNCFDTRQFLMDNYVRFGRISGTHGNGGVSRARRAVPLLRLSDVTDIRAGTVSQEDAGVPGQSSSRFTPREMGDGSAVAGPGIKTGGSALARCLEFSAREKGVEFMLNRHMDELIREEPFSGKVLGVRASYSPRHDPETGEQLQSFWTNGNVDETAETVNIRARKAVILGSGGHSGNPQFRSMFYPALRDPYFVTSGWALLGPNSRNASGIKAGMKIGATLSGMQQNLSYGTSFHVNTRLATRDAYTPMLPGHPTFPFRGSAGFSVNANGREHLITVNQVGKRFFNELNFVRGAGHAQYPAQADVPNPGVDHIQADWRNCRPEWVVQSYREHHGMHAALAINEGSEGPDYFPGPVWAIFDSAAVERAGWNIEPPFTNTENGQFFVADTIEELAEKIQAGNEFQRVPLSYLADTVEKWNEKVDAGYDEEFERGEDAPMHKLDAPPFYAASQMIIWHDSYGGLRINGKAQVVDLEGETIPGLYAGGEASGGGNQHGIGRATVHGYIAGTNAVEEQEVAAARVAKRAKVAV
ncbi:MAG: FAD-binding protein [Trueperaceae bacterium]